jgi:small subunit ribosomal protein S16
MGVKIRLSRQGAKKNPQYMVVATNSNTKRDGEYLEKLGYYFPKAKAQVEKLKVNREALQAWIAKGAQLTDTVAELVKGSK